MDADRWPSFTKWNGSGNHGELHGTLVLGSKGLYAGIEIQVADFCSQGSHKYRILTISQLIQKGVACRSLVIPTRNFRKPLWAVRIPSN